MQSEDILSGQSISLRPGVTLHACYAPGESPALVFLHGGLGNRYNWRSQYEFAQAQGWAALAYDLAGHGQSHPYRRYSIGRHCRDLSRLLRHFHIRNPVLCCHSYGVPIGLEWAQRHPTSALVLVCGGTHDLAPWWEAPLVNTMAWGGRHLYRWAAVQQLTNILSSSHRHQTVEQFLVESPTPVERHPYEAMKIFWGYNFFARRKTDRHLNIPTLVISGGQDAVFNQQMGDELAAHFKTSHHLHLPTAGHLVMAEYPDVVNQAIATWVRTFYG
jgi:pimeloyl-ACP methyl ester carboxylesterase